MLDFNLPYLNDEHKSLAMLIEEFCEREVDLRAFCDMADQPIPPNATPAQLRSRLPLELLSKAHDAGIRQICAPQEYGGGAAKKTTWQRAPWQRWPDIWVVISAGL